MEKFRKDVVFEGINNEIRDVIAEKWGRKEVLFLDDFCENNAIELLIEVDGYKERCLVGYDDEETSENICDVLLEMYEAHKIYDEPNHVITVKMLHYDEVYFVCNLELKDYCELTLVDKLGNEINTDDSDFIECVVNAVDLSLYNGNFQHTQIYKNAFPDSDENISDDEYNDRYGKMIDDVLESVKTYLMSDTENRFDIDYSTHIVSSYFFYSVPQFKDAYIDDICDVLDYKDR